jgi:hypothetical protein
VRGKDAGRARIGNTSATEDAASRRRARPGGSGVYRQTLLVAEQDVPEQQHGREPRCESEQEGREKRRREDERVSVGIKVHRNSRFRDDDRPVVRSHTVRPMR